MSEKNAIEEADGDAQGEGISPVTQVKRPAMNVKALFSLAAVGVVIVALVSMVITRLQAQRRLEAFDKRAADQAATASSAGAQPLKVVANPAGIPPTAGGVQPTMGPGSADIGHTLIPAIDAEATDVAPIGVFPAQFGALPQRAGAVRAGAASPVPVAPPDPLDAPVLLTPAPAMPGNASAGAEGAIDDGMTQA